MVKTVVLAAGSGSRLKSDKVKVLHRIFDKPILSWVLESLSEVESEDIIVVCGHQAEEVKSFLHAYPVSTVIQEEQLGTGHALMCVREQLQGYEGTVLVINGDSPLIRAETLNDMIKFHQDNIVDISFLSCHLNHPDGYGRVIRKDNRILAIKEDKDCSEAERQIKEVNAGVYCFEWSTVEEGLNKLKNDNAQEEYYLTDIIGWADSQGHEISACDLKNPYEVLGVNTREDLSLVWKLKNEATLHDLMQNGVTIVDPASTFISSDADIGEDTIILPNTYIQRRVVIGKGCNIGPNTSIYGPAEIGENSQVIQSHISRSSIGANAMIGPFAHIRDGSDINDNVRIGNFVEIKNSAIGDNCAAAHLSYIGDAQLKNNVNVGAGTIIANYDHRTGEKYETVINARVSTGANSVLIAPIKIGERSIVAAGSVVTKDVPEDTLAIARPKQEHKRNKQLTK
ncbi:MAG: bifunctional UDP-N-acetylglucosamine diphosphorylase/glucosamine-1-phosphate N-acetyltransferase GlmU [Candidatus Melainabacteria bacterium]|jgi:bifunctional UDP-N-acetylglucosamine pyrophosphorylase / glucosamine-1-phosphate N-acetyltransferase|nr:bifunctional UDP-N-acetylglucosamine diphosphorylase/glucosamine-1-phosphate N-acetyltransferase GlmU [Candidatus Melainabacteria bacterium]